MTESFLDQLGYVSISFVGAATFWKGYSGFTQAQLDQLMFMRTLTALYFVAWIVSIIIREVGETKEEKQ